MVVQFIDFLTLSTLICRGTDISKCFSKSLEIRDNESRLYSKSVPTMCILDKYLNRNQFEICFLHFLGKKGAGIPCELSLYELSKIFSLFFFFFFFFFFFLGSKFRKKVYF